MAVVLLREVATELPALVVAETMTTELPFVEEVGTPMLVELRRVLVETRIVALLVTLLGLTVEGLTVVVVV